MPWIVAASATGGIALLLTLGGGLGTPVLIGAALIALAASAAIGWAVRGTNAARSPVVDLLDHSPIAHIAIDRAGLIRSANQAAVDLFGWPRPLLEAMAVNRLLPDHGALLEDHQASGAPRDMAGLRRDGSRLALEVLSMPIEADGAPRILLAIGDAARHQARLGIEEHQRAIIASSVDAIISETLDGTIRSWNAGAEQVFDIMAAQAIGRRSRDILPVQLAASDESALVELFAGRQIPPYEAAIVHADGRRALISTTVSPIRDRQGKLIGVSRISRDISDMIQLMNELAESEARFREMANALPQLTWTTDAQGRTDFRGKQFEDYTGRTYDAPYATLHDAVHVEDRQRLLDGWAEAVRAGEPFFTEMRIRRADGEYRWFDARAVPIKNRHGAVIRWFGSATDIQDRQDFVASLERHARELERSNAALEEFAYAASHDLQEPLRMVASYTQLIQRRYVDALDAEGQAMFGYAIEGAVRMQRLVNDLLAYSRLRHPASPDSVGDPAAAIDTVRELLRDAIKENGATIDVAPDLPPVTVARAALVQLFQNLIANALRYRSDAAPHIRIAATAGADGMAGFTVADNGVGIDPRHADRIFRIFQRLRGDRGGTGIGLALCRRIVENVGGKIRVESDGASGSTFHFTLPLAPDAPTPEGHPEPPKKEPS